MKRIFKAIKKGMDTIGQAFGLVFVWLYRVFIFLLDNSIGLLFTQTFKSINKKYQKEYVVWERVKRILIFTIVVVGVIGFQSIYRYTLQPVFRWVLYQGSTWFSETDVYHKILMTYGDEFAEGIGVTLYLSLVGTVIGFMFSIVLSGIATMEIGKQDHEIVKGLKWFGKAFVKLYTTVIRGTPMMVQAMVLYWGIKGFFNWDVLTAGLVTVTINTTAYLTEVMRGAIQSLDKGQKEAGASLGLSRTQTMINVIFPQAIKNVMPSIGNEFVINIKDTAVLSVILITDIFRVSEYALGKYIYAFPPFIIAAIIYLFLTTTVTGILKQIEKRLDLPQVSLPSANGGL